MIIPAPTAIMKRNPTPLKLRNPSPAMVCPSPSPTSVRTPGIIRGIRDPDITVRRMSDPKSMRRKIIVEMGDFYTPSRVFIFVVIFLVLIWRFAFRRTGHIEHTTHHKNQN
jgi:hypothetical protein